MKFEVDRDTFCSALARAAGVVSKDTAMPMLRNVLLTAEVDQPVELSATDLEISLRTRTQAIVHEGGRIAAPAREMLAVVRGLWEDRVMIELSGENQSMIKITAGKSKRKLACMAAEDFPMIDSVHEMEFGGCDKAELLRAVSRTLFVIPSESTGFNIPGALLHRHESGYYRLVGSDGHRLSYCGIPDTGLPGLEVGAGVVVPRKGLQECTKLLEASGDAFVACDGTRIVFKTDGGTLSVRLLDPSFPSYGEIIPEERPFSFSIDAQRLNNTLASMMPLLPGATRMVGFHITPGTLTLRSATNPEGDAEDQLEIQYDSDEFSIYFNAKYWIEALKAIDGRVRIEWLDKFHGAILLDEGDAHGLNLIMPMVA